MGCQSEHGKGRTPIAMDRLAHLQHAIQGCGVASTFERLACAPLANDAEGVTDGKMGRGQTFGF